MVWSSTFWIYWNRWRFPCSWFLVEKDPAHKLAVERKIKRFLCLLMIPNEITWTLLGRWLNPFPRCVWSWSHSGQSSSLSPYFLFYWKRVKCRMSDGRRKLNHSWMLGDRRPKRLGSSPSQGRRPSPQLTCSQHRMMNDKQTPQEPPLSPALSNRLATAGTGLTYRESQLTSGYFESLCGSHSNISVGQCSNWNHGQEIITLMTTPCRRAK